MMREPSRSEEREIQRSRGIPISRFWPILVMLGVESCLLFDLSLFERCLGMPIEDGRGAGIAVFLLTLPCSPYLLSGSWFERTLFIALWLPVPFAVLNYRWARRHEAHWDKVRLREAERRKERRLAKKAAENAEDSGA
jgi:hypothetical protein